MKISKISVDSNSTFTMGFYCSIDYCVEFILGYEILCKNCSNFMPNWFHPYFLKGNLLEEGYKWVQIIQTSKILRGPFNYVFNMWPCKCDFY